MSKQTADGFLESITIAAPCTVNWNEMTGDERTRFCNDCQKNVYNISEMSRKDAERLIQAKEGKVCVRMYRRTDGTVINDNCPVGLRALRNSLRAARQRVWKVAAASAALFSSIFLGSAARAEEGKDSGGASQKQGAQSEPAKTDKNGPAQPTMGAVCPPQLTEAQLKIEKSARDQVSKSILTAAGKTKLTTGSLQFFISGGQINRASIAISSGDKQLDAKILSATEKTKLTGAEMFPNWQSININLSDLKSAEAK